MSFSFNSDVMLLNLTKLRTNIWKGRWKNAINKLGNARASLNVDDVLNNVADKEPNVLHTLPCVWNVQLANGFADLCYYNVSKMKVRECFKLNNTYNGQQMTSFLFSRSSTGIPFQRRNPLAKKITTFVMWRLAFGL